MESLNFEDGMRLTIICAPDGHYEDCRKCHFNGNGGCLLCDKGCNLPWPFVFVLSDESNNEK